MVLFNLCGVIKMPTYEYKCRNCGKEFEIVQRITEPSLTVCPDEQCSGEVYRKISKNIGLVFNGSGFYLTDYVHKNDKAPTKNGNGTAKSKNSSDATTTKSDTGKETAVTANAS